MGRRGHYGLRMQGGENPYELASKRAGVHGVAPGRHQEGSRGTEGMTEAPRGTWRGSWEGRTSTAAT